MSRAFSSAQIRRTAPLAPRTSSAPPRSRSESAVARIADSESTSTNGTSERSTTMRCGSPTHALSSSRRNASTVSMSRSPCSVTSVDSSATSSSPSTKTLPSDPNRVLAFDVTVRTAGGQEIHRIVLHPGWVTADPGAARGWALVPLRLFLGVTFTFAGLQKLADPSYLDGSSPLSVQATIHALEHQSPIGFLLAASGHAPRLVGVLIALGELAVGLATLLGLWVRLTALGGLLLATTFFLTVSWHTRPYYYGSDIVFMAAWSVPLLRGTWDGPTVDAWIRRRAARDPDPQRRALVLGGVGAATLAVTGGGGAAASAGIGRALHRSTPATSASPPPTHATHAAAHPRRTTPPPSPRGRVVARVADVPAG